LLLYLLLFTGVLSLIIRPVYSLVDALLWA
jgi:hypothetical protein